ncbi:MAG: 7-cyano-7-deazaguanine synthase QueC [Candidatus Latescibacteria bacterium]|nr:7-cyano-7-deazaguanine synthase QueC [Candidatus Latescibacterota bacterium]
MARSPAIALVSGGLDSCVAAAIAADRGEVAFLHLNYRQRTERRELEAFAAIADHYQVGRRLVVEVSYLQQIGGSSLIDPALPVPEGETEGVPSTYVPFRNANLLGVAVAWAEVLGARRVYIGAHEEESQYPDCRAAFFAAYNRMIAQGTRPGARIRVETPLIALDKGAIVRRGVELGAPLHLTWSCYQREDQACGRCHSCRLRLDGFARAGLPDPIPYC